MKSQILKNLLPHVGPILIIIVAAFLYCFPVIEGKEIVQTDIVNNKAQYEETKRFREEHGEEPLWTTRVFSGMTTFNIGTEFNTNILIPIGRLITSIIPAGVNLIVISCIGFYIMLVLFGVSPWLALIGALGYGLSSNLLVSLMAGHNTKILGIAYMAPAVASVVIAYRGRIFIGAALSMLFIGLLVMSNHYQIVYYFLLISLIVGITYFVHAITTKTLPQFAKTTLILVVAGIIGFIPNFSKIYNVYEHGKETIRGGRTLLSSRDKADEGGLDRDYAMSWSYGIMESFTVVVPSFMGGASGEALPENGNVAEALNKFQLSRQQKEQILAQAPTYVGDQPFILGPVYFGAAFIFLFILALFIVNERIKVWVIAISVLSFFIAWGRHFEIFTDLMFDYFPFYNKFRTPSMALAIAGFAMPFLALFGLQQVFSGKVDNVQFKKAMRMALYVTGGLMALLLLYGLTSDWIGPNDKQYQGKNSPWGIDEIYQALLADRKGRFMNDWLLSTAIMAICAALLWFYKKGSVKTPVVLAVLALVIAGDSWRVSKRYLNNDNFVTSRNYDAQFAPTPADQAILADNDPHFRVVNLTRNPWTDGMTSYHHENIGGHHAAKLQRYQDLIENQLSPQLQFINRGLLQSGDRIMLNPEVAQQLSAFNMLNTKYYVVQNDENGVVMNPKALGNAWFVTDLRKVNTADEEMAAIAEIDPASTAIVHQEFAEALYNYQFGRSDGANVTLTSVLPNRLTYTSQNSVDGLAVFSELYYPNGWNAFVDGEPAEVYRVNYLLRAMKLPAGTHEIEMRFEPSSYVIGERVSLGGSILAVVFAGSMIALYYRKRKSLQTGKEA